MSHFPKISLWFCADSRTGPYSSNEARPTRAPKWFVTAPKGTENNYIYSLDTNFLSLTIRLTMIWSLARKTKAPYQMGMFLAVFLGNKNGFQNIGMLHLL